MKIISFMTGPYHIETSPLICTGNQWTGFYMKGSSVMKELIYSEAVAWWCSSAKKLFQKIIKNFKKRSVPESLCS